MSIQGHSLAVVIPAYRAAGTIASVVRAVPAFVDHIIIVNDCSPDNLSEVLADLTDPRLVVMAHEKNQGVGGAMITGFRRAMELNAAFVAKVDADGQMDPAILDRFVRMALRFDCDYVKANRFGHVSSLEAMPRLRLWGNILLTFATKFASGYWNLFDPQNGYVMVSRRMLKRLDLECLDRSYFFENSMLINLNILRARIGEIYLPAVYGGEVSSLHVGRVLRSFPLKLFRGLTFRIYEKYVFRSISPIFPLLSFGLASLAFALMFGGYAWSRSVATGIPAATGTVTLALLAVLMSVSCLLQAMVLDVHDAGECVLLDWDDESLAEEGHGADAWRVQEASAHR
jgi:dolichol-phosphate mannosyltransferase